MIRQALNDLSYLLVERFILLAKESIKDHNSFHVGFSGGISPQFFYSLLAKTSQEIQWNKVHIYLTDERFVPFSHKESNLGMLKRMLIAHVPIPASNIHPIQTENITPDKSAELYCETLNNYLPKSDCFIPQIDFILLGLGEDGHIASLFPKSNLLHIENSLAAAEFIQPLRAWRISLTFPIINNAKWITLLVANPNKAKIINYMMTKNTSKSIYPVTLLQPKGQFEIFIDSPTYQNLSLSQD